MSAQAQWSKRYRQRQRAGLIVVEAEVCEVELVEALIASRLLEPTQADDRAAINAAVERLLEHFTGERT